MGQPRILLLFSGGLDSLLAARLLKEVGALRRVRISFREFKPLLDAPAHGFGRALNPCIDCKIMFMRKAKEILQAEGFDAVASGEVLGERPMSQNKQALDIIEKEAGLEGKLLRPLSAQLLPETETEKKGLIDRGELLDIQGRGRKTQLELAKKWDIEKFATPSGGCLLTEPQYSSKLKDLLNHPREATDETVALLKVGRHFRYPDGRKLIVGRNKEENEELFKHDQPGRFFLEVKSTGSPIGLLFLGPPEKDELSFWGQTPGSPQENKVFLWGASIVARYSAARAKPQVVVTCWDRNDNERTLTVAPAKDSELEGWRL
jgi:tRNA U34 2-thiouridine synthase MnmA/TrmU